VEKARYIWMDGALVPWDDAQVHVLTHTLHYGLGAFEGIRCYDTVRGPAIFRHREHVDRLFNSAKIGGMTLPYTKDQIAEATRNLIRENEQKAVYIRPLVWFGNDRLGVNNIGITVHVMIASYVFVTPPIGSALGGITRETLIRIAQDDGIEVKEDRLVRDRLYTADEVFLTGTAAEVTPVREVDRRQVGTGGRGPIVERLQKKFFSVVRGEDPRYASWLDPIGVPAKKA
jgi:branched-subunit amino acid aminotransferase/4-amino-4-deoxychorismate lyase